MGIIELGDGEAYGGGFAVAAAAGAVEVGAVAAARLGRVGAGGVPAGSDRLAVVGEVGQPGGPGREGIGDRDAGGPELGDEAGVLGGVGAFPPDPLGDVSPSGNAGPGSAAAVRWRLGRS
jgi:hypothetical protein